MVIRRVPRRWRVLLRGFLLLGSIHEHERNRRRGRLIYRLLLCPEISRRASNLRVRSKPVLPLQLILLSDIKALRVDEMPGRLAERNLRETGDQQIDE